MVKKSIKLIQQHLNLNNITKSEKIEKILLQKVEKNIENSLQKFGKNCWNCVKYQ